MIWGGITMEAKTELHVFRRPSMNSNIYIRDVLEEYVVPFAPYIGVTSFSCRTKHVHTSQEWSRRTLRRLKSEKWTGQLEVRILIPSSTYGTSLKGVFGEDRTLRKTWISFELRWLKNGTRYLKNGLGP